MTSALESMEKEAVVLNQPEVKELTPGTVGVCASETGRYTVFAIAMQGLQSPPGSVTKWRLGSDTASARNDVCEQMVGDWVWFMDDDHNFAPDILIRLLQRDVPIVSPLCLRRTQPFYPVSTVDDNVLDVTRYGPDELVPVQFTGSAGMVIRREVIEAVEPPWFELGNGISEDVNFCRKAAAAGFPIYVDLGVPLGHITTCVIWPSHDGERWLTGFDIADGASLAVEPTSPLAAVEE